MKIAISGKGGVGKTTLAACLAKYYAQKNYKVIAVDADPDANLASALGLEYEKASKIIPL
ncbi:MAG: nucleotide-binding protein, partial [Nitrososphaeraceae archaeon]